jgi:hypothetical protein
MMARAQARQLPLRATESAEIDILPIAHNDAAVDHLSNILDGRAGQDSQFLKEYGFFIDGVGAKTAILPHGWWNRVVAVQNANTAAPGGDPQYTGLCLDPEDLCVAKLCAFREKDRLYVAALLDASPPIVHASLIVERLAEVEPEHRRAADNAIKWLDMWLR